MPSGPAHPSIAYARPYATAEEIFGKAMTAVELVDRVRSYSWRGAFYRLACLASIVANDPVGAFSERVRRFTVDPLGQLTGGLLTGALLANGRAFLRSRRDEVVLAHEEVISFLQHLVLLEGGEGDDAPGDQEIALWLAGANGHLARWADERLVLPDDVRLAAELVRISRFNNRHDLLKALVRASGMFGRKPSTGQLADEQRWKELETTAFPSGFQDAFEIGLGLVSMLAKTWGTEDSKNPNPVLNCGVLFATSKVSPDTFVAALEGFVTSREDLRARVRQRLRPDGLPHAPMALYHTPLVELEPRVFVAASPWAVTGLLRTGIWAKFLQASKTRDPHRGAATWLPAFGYMFEDWCRKVATEAAGSPQRKATVLLPSSPGAADEVEDVVLVDDGIAVLCSAKSRLIEARIAREAVSASAIVSWLENFFFEERGDDQRGGVVRQLSGRIDKLRSGEFEKSGLARDTRVCPLIVTYDSLGESDILYRQIEEGCRRRGLLQQPNVGPLALARVEEFEQLLSRVARGLDVSGLLESRGAEHRHRRLDQILHEAEIQPAPRLPFFEVEAKALNDRMFSRISGGRS